MPYRQFTRNGKYCIQNKKTGNITCFNSESDRAQGIRIREAFAHGWKPTRVKAHTRKGRYVRRHNRR